MTTLEAYNAHSQTKIRFIPISKGVLIQKKNYDGTIQETELLKRDIAILYKFLEKIKDEQDKTKIATQESTHHCWLIDSQTDVHAVCWPGAPNHLSIGHILFHNSQINFGLQIPAKSQEGWQEIYKALETSPAH